MSREFKCLQVRYKERGKSEQLSKHIGHLTEDEVIKFFGLDDPEIEWYNVEEVSI